MSNLKEWHKPGSYSQKNYLMTHDLLVQECEGAGRGGNIIIRFSEEVCFLSPLTKGCIVTGELALSQGCVPCYGASDVRVPGMSGIWEDLADVSRHPHRYHSVTKTVQGVETKADDERGKKENWVEMKLNTQREARETGEQPWCETGDSLRSGVWRHGNPTFHSFLDKEFQRFSASWSSFVILFPWMHAFSNLSSINQAACIKYWVTCLLIN